MFQCTWQTEDLGSSLTKSMADRPNVGQKHAASIRGICLDEKKVKSVIILHGFKKKTMAISRKDLDIAKARKEEIDSL